MTEGLPNDPLGIRRLRDRRQRFRERARAEYVAGAEQEWLQAHRTAHDGRGARAGAAAVSGDL